MQAYTISQWLLFFYFYGLCGWLWESCIVSICQKRWVNRGFLNGPLLPIYGFGAILILITTQPVRGSLWGIALLGALSATVLEYGTGAAMERIFKVRYWDYSTKRWNLHGYICASSTVVWGVFSVLLVRMIHPPIVGVLLEIPVRLATPLVVVLCAGATVDMVRSIRTALNLQTMLTQITEENEELRRLAKRIEVVAAFAEEDLHKFRRKTDLNIVAFEDELANQWQIWREKQSRKFRTRQKIWEISLMQKLEAKRQAAETLLEEIEQHRAQLEASFAEETDAGRQSLSDALEQLRNHYARLRMAAPKQYKSARRLLRGNPTARTRRYQEALHSLTHLGNEDKDE